MICTYCGRRGHGAARCKLRSAFAAIAAAAVAVVLAGCAKTPVEPADIRPPAAHLMKPPADEMAAIPACEAEKRCRSAYYAAERAERSELRGQVRGLQAWARTVTRAPTLRGER